MKPSKLYVGVDVSCDKLDVSFLNGQARTARPWASYANDHGGPGT